MSHDPSRGALPLAPGKRAETIEEALLSRRSLRAFRPDPVPRETIERLVRLASHVVASEGGAALVTGADDPRIAAERLSASHPGFICVTAGEKGCWWGEGGTIRHTPAPVVEAVDTLAAGDVFHGAFAFGLVEGWALQSVVGFASAAAAIKCTRFGGRLGAPTRKEVATFLARLA